MIRTPVRSCSLGLLAALLAAAGCDVATAAPPSGGVPLGDAGTVTPGSGKDATSDAAVPPACPRGLLVIDTDYMTTNVSVVGLDGALLQPSLLSSGSAGAGTSAPLSGDVVVPREASASGDVVLVDRYPNAVVTWVDPADAHVIAQLPVGTGFAANPHDYLEVSPTKAYVTRYQANLAAGKVPFDEGSDLLVIDTSQPGAPKITGRIDLTAEGGGFVPRPDRMVRVGNDVVVTLGRLGQKEPDFTPGGDGRLVGIDPATDAVRWRLDVPGLAGCSGLAVSPSQKALALTCGGVFDATGTIEQQATRSGVALFDLTTVPPMLVGRHVIAPAQGLPPILQPTIAWVSEDVLFGTVYGDFEAKTQDAAYTLDRASGAFTKLVGSGSAFSYGDVACAAGCTDLCFLADADRTVLQPFRWNGAGLVALPGLVVDPSPGLPPRALGLLR